MSQQRFDSLIALFGAAIGGACFGLGVGCLYTNYHPNTAACLATCGYLISLVSVTAFAVVLRKME